MGPLCKVEAVKTGQKSVLSMVFAVMLSKFDRTESLEKLSPSSKQGSKSEIRSLEFEDTLMKANV